MDVAIADAQATTGLAKTTATVRPGAAAAASCVQLGLVVS
jgi:hypothetical protein